MKSLVEQMAFYRSYHTTFGCKFTHWFGIPLVTFSILIPMAWAGLPIGGFRVTLEMVFVAATLGYYFMLDKLLATIMVVCILPLAWAAAGVADKPMGEGVWIFLAAFAGGVALQLAGHFIEGKRPALVDNFFQAVFTAPLFLVAEAISPLGWKPAGEKKA